LRLGEKKKAGKVGQKGKSCPTDRTVMFRFDLWRAKRGGVGGERADEKGGEGGWVFSLEGKRGRLVARNRNECARGRWGKS